MWFDGASNIVGNEIGVVLISPEDLCFPFAVKLGFDCTNNMAEYEAHAMGLLMALEYQVKRLKVFVDSALVIYQLYKEWEMRDAKLIPYHDHVKEIVTAFDAVTFCHVPCEENQMEDALATLFAMVQINEGQEMTIRVRQQLHIAYCQCLTCETIEPNIEPWYFDIKRYLEKGEYPEGAPENSKRTLRRLASDFLLSGVTLYKRNTDMTFLQCVDSQEAEQIMGEVHEGIFGTHVNGHALARKVLRGGYYWTQMESDCCQHVRKCAKCRTYANYLNVALSALHNLNAPLPFSIALRAVPNFPPSLHTLSSQDNGAVEAANKNLKKIIQKMVVTCKDWHEILPYALHGYRMSVRTSTRAILYSLVYGTEAVVLIEVEIPSLRVLAEVELEEAEWVQQRLDQLNLIEEKRLTALCHGQLYQRRVKKAFDKR
ncbi:rnhA, partial [Mucuna pruriens]